MKFFYLPLIIGILTIIGCSNSDSEIQDESLRLISIENSIIEFSNTVRGGSSLQLLKLSNDGDTSLNLNYSIPDRFQLNQKIGQNISSLPPNGSLELEIEFFPNEIKDYNSVLEISNDSENNPNIIVQLIGKGTELVISYDRLILGNQSDIDKFGLIDADYFKVDKLDIIDITDGQANNITNLGPLSKIKEVNNFYLGKVKKINSIEGISDINVTKTFTISNTDFSNLNLFESMIRNDISYSFFYNNSLDDLSVLSNVSSLNFLIIDSSPLLVNLNSLSNVKTFSSIDIRSTGITNLAFLNHLTTGIDIRLTNNSQLSDFCGIQSIYSTSSLSISNNLHNPSSVDFENGNCKLN